MKPPKLTRNRRTWLKLLRDHGPQMRPGGRGGGVATPLFCMRAGWSEWLFRVRASGELIGISEALRRYGSAHFDKACERTGMERLTTKGALMLEQSGAKRHDKIPATENA